MFLCHIPLTNKALIYNTKTIYQLKKDRETR